MEPSSNSSPVTPAQPADPQPQPQDTLQTNVQQTPVSPVASPTVPLPPQASAAPVQPPVLGQSADNKVFSHLRPWLILLAVSASAEILASFASLRPAELAIWAGGLVLSYKAISKMKATNIDELKQSDKDLMIFYMAIDTIFAQLLYYFRLRKSLPNTAKLALSIGWKVLVLQLIFVVVLGIALASIFH